jgi:hypothetical protein
MHPPGWRASKRAYLRLSPGGIFGGSSGPPLGLQPGQGMPGAPHLQARSEIPHGTSSRVSHTQRASSQRLQLGAMAVQGRSARIASVTAAESPTTTSKNIEVSSTNVGRVFCSQSCKLFGIIFFASASGSSRSLRRRIRPPWHSMISLAGYFRRHSLYAALAGST